MCTPIVTIIHVCTGICLASKETVSLLGRLSTLFFLDLNKEEQHHHTITRVPTKEELARYLSRVCDEQNVGNTSIRRSAVEIHAYYACAKAATTENTVEKMHLQMHARFQPVGSAHEAPQWQHAIEEEVHQLMHVRQDRFECC